MPTYVYRIVVSPTDPPGSPERTFEIRQSIHDAPLTHHPETGEPVERVILPPMISRGPASNSELGALGFTKYKKTADGSYERQAGSGGPKVIDPRKLGDGGT